MRRPWGVMTIALLVITSSAWAMSRAVKSPHNRAGHEFLVASVVLSILALLAAEALWNLRPYAFLAFTLWSICVVATLVLFRLTGGSSAHLVRLFGPIASAGIVYAAVALYLRRVV